MTELPGPGARSLEGWEPVYQNPWYTMLRKDNWHILAPTNIRIGSAVLVVDALDRVLLLETYRRAIDEVCLETPRGMVDQGETERACARRELWEETGLVVEDNDLVDLGQVYPEPGVLCYRIAIFGVRLKTPFPELTIDLEEAVGHQIVPMHQFLEMVSDGRISDGVTALSALRFESGLEMREKGNAGVQKTILILDETGATQARIETRRPDWSFEQYTRNRARSGWSWRFAPDA